MFILVIFLHVPLYMTGFVSWAARNWDWKLFPFAEGKAQLATLMSFIVSNFDLGRPEYTTIRDKKKYQGFYSSLSMLEIWNFPMLIFKVHSRPERREWRWSVSRVTTPVGSGLSLLIPVILLCHHYKSPEMIHCRPWQPSRPGPSAGLTMIITNVTTVM